jgi:transposase
MSERKKKEISNEIRKLIISKHEQGESIVNISKICNLNYNSVKSIIRRFKQNGSIEIKQRSGRPKKVTPRRERNIIREMKKNRKLKKNELLRAINDNQNIKISSFTLKRLLNKNGYNQRKARKKPFISSKNKKLRKKWANEHLNWSIYKWTNVVWCDECHVEHDNKRNVLVWRKSNEEWTTECLQPVFKSGRFSISIWGCVGWNGVGPIRIIEGKLKAEKYKNLLQDVIPEIKSKFGTRIKFQDDNIPIHRATIVNKCKEDNDIESMEWAAQSPDLSIIENVWSLLKDKLSKYDHVPSSPQVLKDRVINVWNNISTSYIRDLIKSMPRRCQLVIDKQGGITKY